MSAASSLNIASVDQRFNRSTASRRTALYFTPKDQNRSIYTANLVYLERCKFCGAAWISDVRRHLFVRSASRPLDGKQRGYYQ